MVHPCGDYSISIANDVIRKTRPLYLLKGIFLRELYGRYIDEKRHCFLIRNENLIAWAIFCVV